MISQPFQRSGAAIGLASATIFIAVLILGCDTEHGPGDWISRPTPLPSERTARGTILRLIATYELKKIVEYEALLTGDFTYEFSSAIDPELVQRYPTGWSRADERISARNLFFGGVNERGEYWPAATSIDINFASTYPVDDPDSPDLERYKTLLTRVDGRIVIPTSPETSDYIIENNIHRIFLVRGDAAIGLDSTQIADQSHWYIWRWVDETQSSVSPTMEPQPTEAVAWSRVKGIYR